MRLLVENRFALLGLVMVALAALFGVASALGATGAGTGGGVAEDPEVVEVESATRACPAPRGDDRASELAAFAPGNQQETGSLSVAENSGDDDRLGTAERMGQPWSEDTTDADRFSVARAEDGFATGLEVAQITLGEDDPYATEVRCVDPSVSTWFTAPGGEALQGTQLLLSNVDDDPATVSVDIYAPDGPVLAEETRGISIDPHDDEDISLTHLVEDTESIAVHVRSSKGRVGASLFAERTDLGQDWVPPTTEPAKRHVIPGVPEGGGTRRLVVATPDDEPATVSARVLTPDGEVEHESLDDLSVPPAASAMMSLEGPMEQQPGTVVVESDRPVAAGVAMERDSGEDTSYTAATAPLEGPLSTTAVVPANPEDTQSKLLFGAPKSNASVVVTAFGEEGAQGESQQVDIEAGHTLVAEVPSPEDAHALAIQVPEDSGPVYGARELTQSSDDDRATSTVPLRPAPTEVALPAVSDSLTSAVP
ncbi:hypothetical protein F4561_004728 [Lipingzhangella halophila]|uniref:Uncharacterized protein n=1 Tax=Lipingzhangella halophila TaxID=1783352 RepID=A0A7W7RLT6_9ACTN|nr:DUF5719 family protein [Lipingzhangella halophila]MBB4933908.1 hypothetical protein [Lipingzhangella halophila]